MAKAPKASLQGRLADLACPALIVWGESDGIVDVDYGRRYAQSIAGARYEIVADAGHFPHIEQLDTVVRLIDGFAAADSAERARG